MVFVNPSLPEEVRLLESADGLLRGVIAIHSTVLGPAAGGCRLLTYADDAEATRDALRLAQGMARKNALAGLPLGGGKAVLCLPASPFDRSALFRSFGDAVASFRGRFVTAEDVGTNEADMEAAGSVTTHVAGLPARSGQSGGNPSPWTARGVFLSMRVAAERRLERPLADCTVAIQGVGHVGGALTDLLQREGCRVLVTDRDAAAVEQVVRRTGATAVSADAIVAASADILAPCALGATLNAPAVRALRAKVVCGAANNQLATPEDGDRLADAGVLYAPDYVVNAGGIINVAAEYLGWTEAKACDLVERTGERLKRLLDHAERYGIAPGRAADALADDLLARRTIAEAA